MELIVTAKKIRHPSDVALNNSLIPRIALDNKLHASLGNHNPPESKRTPPRSSNRISHEDITLSLILSYFGLFLRKRTFSMFILLILMGGIIALTHIPELWLKIPKPMTQYIIPIVHCVTATLIGIAIMRSVLLSQRQKTQKFFFNGFLSFLVMHLIINVLIIMSLFLVNTLFIKSSSEANPNAILFLNTVIVSFVSSALLSRFCLIIPAMIYDNWKLFGTLSSQMTPYFKYLFMLLFCAKMICLNIVVFSEYIPLNNAVIAIKIIVPAFYYIFIYTFIGICFKLLLKHNSL